MYNSFCLPPSKNKKKTIQREMQRENKVRECYAEKCFYCMNVG